MSDGADHFSLLRGEFIPEGISKAAARAEVMHEPGDVVDLEALAAFAVRTGRNHNLLRRRPLLPLAFNVALAFRRAVGELVQYGKLLP